jgi:PHD/YefM family antitoxin component YafN of YafNO toxin-antitoxin module
MATRVIPKTQLRDRIREELDGLGDDTLVITDRGRAIAVAVSVERWNGLQENAETLADRVAVLEHRIGSGPLRPIERVLDDIEAEDAHLSGGPHQRR